MMVSRALRPLCSILVIAIGIPSGFAQALPAPVRITAQEPIPSPLKIAVLEGDNAINSIPLRQSVTPVIEVRDQNEFPIEGVALVFTLPEHGPGGTFPGGRSSFSTLSDAHGQASAPFVVNNLPGKFQIRVTATAGSRKGEVSITQTNSTGAYIGPPQPSRPLYKKKSTWLIIGGAAATAIIVILVTRKSSSSTSSTSTIPITITPGGPAFQ